MTNPLREALRKIADHEYTEDDYKLSTDEPTMIWQAVARAALAKTEAPAEPIAAFYLTDSDVHCHLRPPRGATHEHYAYLVVQMVRHVADCFKLTEGHVWTLVGQIRKRPQPKIRRAS